MNTRTFNCKCPRCAWTARYVTRTVMFDLACPHCGCMRLIFQSPTVTPREMNEVTEGIEELKDFLDILASIPARLIAKAGL